jgi:cell division protease FtsH
VNRTVRTIIGYTLVITLLIVAAQSVFGSAGPEEVPLSEFQEKIEAGEFAAIRLRPETDALEGFAQVPENLADPKAEADVLANFPAEVEGELTQELRANEDIVFASVPVNTSLWQFVGSFLPFLLLIGMMFFFFSRMQGGGNKVMQFGKSKAKQFEKNQIKVTFDDVAGLEEAIEELAEIKEFLQTPEKFQAIGAKIPKGVLLFGPPGTGKTLLAKAVAGEADVPFFALAGSDFVEMFVGVGASRVRDLFEQAKEHPAAIIFIDEIDAVGRHRGAGLGGGHDEREQTLNQLLVELDGFESNSGVIVMAATNRPDILDPALLRPGRFDRQIIVDRPDLKGRQAILGVHAKGKPLSDEIDLKVLARQTPGFTGADLANLINEAALLTARRDGKLIGMKDLEEAIERVIAGPERKSKIMSEDERRLTAYHEGGHTLVGYALPNADPIHKVTIVPRGRAGGYTLALPEDDKSYARRSELTDKLAMLLGGRTAEEIIFVDPTTGAGNDIEKATEIARKMVMEYGMSDKLGPLKYGTGSGEVFLGRDYGKQQDYSDEIAAEIDREVRSLVERAHVEARLILETHIDALHRVAEELLEKETLSADQVIEIFHDVEKWTNTDQEVGRLVPPGLSHGEGTVAAASRDI